MTTPEQPGSWPTDDVETTEKLLRRHRARPVTALDEVAAVEDPFESDAEHEAFLADLYASRRADGG